MFMIVKGYSDLGDSLSVERDIMTYYINVDHIVKVDMYNAMWGAKAKLPDTLRIHTSAAEVEVIHVTEYLGMHNDKYISTRVGSVVDKIVEMENAKGEEDFEDDE